MNPVDDKAPLDPVARFKQLVYSLHGTDDAIRQLAQEIREEAARVCKEIAEGAWARFPSYAAGAEACASALSPKAARQENKAGKASLGAELNAPDSQGATREVDPILASRRLPNNPAVAASEQPSGTPREALHHIAITDDADCRIANDAKAMTAIARAALRQPEKG